MKFSLFYHSLISDWNHGNAHFLRGVVAELLSRGHQVQVFEPQDGWSLDNLRKDHGDAPVTAFHQAYPNLSSCFYTQDSLNLEAIEADSDVIIVHEWNEPWLVNGFAQMHNRLARGSNTQHNCLLLFHDTHHRAVSDPQWLKRFQLEYYDGILAFGDVLSKVYRQHGWSECVWTWHEAADTRIFYPHRPTDELPSGDLVWVGNWGDDERTQELDTYLFGPARELKLKCHIYGVRYPQDVLDRLQQENITYGGWLPNFEAPRIFANHKVTVHVPRRYYTKTLPGIPTIRPFEAMACGIPLISAPWDDCENLFTPGEDYLLAYNQEQMLEHLQRVLQDSDFAHAMADRALETIRASHTCVHRVDQLLDIVADLNHSTAATQFPSDRAATRRALNAQ